MYLISALTLGLVGSLHCVGMCGPIAIAIPLQKKTGQKITGAFIYNFGRILTYIIIGAILGIIGEGFKLAGFQKWVSILTGLLMVLSILVPAIFSKLKNKTATPPIFDKIKQALAKRLSQKSYPSLFVLGMLNGLLPCGLVYIAVAGAIATSDFVSSVLFMLLFGLGTAPMMAAISILGSSISIKFRSFFNKLVPYVVIIIGILFILRGMNLGIPYISPKDKKLEVKQKTEMQHNI